MVLNVHNTNCVISFSTWIATLPTYYSIADPWTQKCLAIQTRHSRNITLVLDLDETLIYSSWEKLRNFDIQFNLTEENKEETVKKLKSKYL